MSLIWTFLAYFGRECRGSSTCYQIAIWTAYFFPSMLNELGPDLRYRLAEIFPYRIWSLLFILYPIDSVDFLSLKRSSLMIMDRFLRLRYLLFQCFQRSIQLTRAEIDYSFLGHFARFIRLIINAIKWHVWTSLSIFGVITVGYDFSQFTGNFRRHHTSVNNYSFVAKLERFGLDRAYSRW